MSHPNSKSKTSLATLFPFSMRDLIVTALILFVAVAFCILLQRLDPSAGFATPVFVLTVLLTSRLTTGYFWGLFSAVLGVIAVNFFFTFPLSFVLFFLVLYKLFVSLKLFNIIILPLFASFCKFLQVFASSADVICILKNGK